MHSKSSKHYTRLKERCCSLNKSAGVESQHGRAMAVPAALTKPLAGPLHRVVASYKAQAQTALVSILRFVERAGMRSP